VISSTTSRVYYYYYYFQLASVYRWQLPQLVCLTMPIMEWHAVLCSAVSEYLPS
jgi:hypothetical protein